MISRIIKVEVGIISLSRRLRLITLTETLITLDITKSESNNCFIIHWTRKNWSHVFASSLTASNTKRANLTWLPLEIMHRGHTWHDYPWPWVSLTWLLYNLQLWRHGRWFRKFTVRFRPIGKELESSMYNNVNTWRKITKKHWSLRDWIYASECTFMILTYFGTKTLKTSRDTAPLTKNNRNDKMAEASVSVTSCSSGL